MHNSIDIILLVIGLLVCGFFLIAYFISSHSFIELILGIIEISFDLMLRPILFFGWYALSGLVVVIVVLLALTYVYLIKPGNLDSVLYRIPSCAELLDRNHVVIDYICSFNGVRLWKPLAEIDKKLPELVVMLEDDKFFEHSGLDLNEIMNSIEKDLEKQKLARGGSTITQQLAKNLFLSKEKSFLRKIIEVPLAIRLEREFDKNQILEFYLNVIEWGPGVYGVEAASRLYFDHSSSQLSDEETWLLALMIPNPHLLNPWVSSECKRSLLARAKRLAERLYQEHHLSKEQTQVVLNRFDNFLDTVRSSRTKQTRGKRKYPARWAQNGSFSFSEIIALRRKASGVFGGFTQGRTLKTFLDRNLQDELEAISGSQNHINENGSVVTLSSGDEIHALVPMPNGTGLPGSILTLASSKHLKPHIWSVRKIPISQVLR